MQNNFEKAWGNSAAEDLFIDLFCEVFGPEKTQYMHLQYPFVDIYGNHRFIDFALESDAGRVAIEIDGETWHSPGKVSVYKYYDDLLKQNSMVHSGWRVFRWTEKARIRILMLCAGVFRVFHRIYTNLPKMNLATW